MIFPVAQTVKNLPAMKKTGVGSLGQKDPLEKGMAIHSSIVAWRIPWTEEPGGPQSMGSQRVGHDWITNTTTTEDSNHWIHVVSWLGKSGRDTLKQLPSNQLPASTNWYLPFPLSSPSPMLATAHDLLNLAFYRHQVRNGTTAAFKVNSRGIQDNLYL